MAILFIRMKCEGLNMAKKKETTNVFEQTCIAPDIYDMWIDASICDEVKPGQFIGVYPIDKTHLLPRPISICEVDKEKKRLRIVYRVVGEGTKEFSGFQSGQHIQILGPLGNGYDVACATAKNVLLLGGGIGIDRKSVV